MHEPIADYYMTLLASRIASELATSVVTDSGAADNLSVVCKAGSALPNPTTLHSDARRWRGRRIPQHIMPRKFAEGALATLAIEGIQIPSDVPISKLLKFRQNYSAELGRFRSAISTLAAGIETDLPLAAMRQKVWDIYTNELQPSLSDLKSALDGQKIGWFAKAMLKTSFLSAGPASLLTTVGLTVPQALIAGVGISLVASGMLYNTERSREINQSPYNYLLRAQQKFG